MAGLLYDYSPFASDDEEEISSSGLLGTPKRKSFSPDMGMLGLAAGLLEPTVNGRLGPAFANGLKGWAGGVAAQGKLDEADAENDPNAMMRKYALQAAIKAKYAKDDSKWSMSPFVDKEGNVVQFSSNGDYRTLPEFKGRFAPQQTVDLGGSVGTFSPNNGQIAPAQPKTPSPSWQAEHPGGSRYETIVLPNGATAQRDNLTGEVSAIPQPDKGPQMPGNLVQATSENDNLVRMIDDTLKGLDQRPSAVGIKNAIPFAEKVQQYLDPNGVDVRADVSRIGSQKVHDISGAAVSLSESKRFSPWIPDPSDTPETIRNKLKNMREEATSINDQIRSQYRPSMPVNGSSGKVSADISNIDDAKRAYDALPTGPEKDALGKVIANSIQQSGPFSVNSSSVAPLRKPSAKELESAREAIRLGHRDEVLKRFKASNVDASEL